MAAVAVALLLLLLLLLPCAADLKDVGRQGERLHTHTRARRHTTRAHTHERARPAGRSPRAPVVPPSATKTSRLAAPAATGGRRQHHSVANISIMFVCGFILLCMCVCSHTPIHTHDTLNRQVIRRVYVRKRREGSRSPLEVLCCV